MLILIFAPSPSGPSNRGPRRCRQIAGPSRLRAPPRSGRWKGRGTLSSTRCQSSSPCRSFWGISCFSLCPCHVFHPRGCSPGACDLYGRRCGRRDPLAWGPVSVNMRATVSEFFKAAALAAFYVVTVHVLARKERAEEDRPDRRRLRCPPSPSSACIQHFLWNGENLLAQGADCMEENPSCPYVNRNHCAGFRRSCSRCP
ncbi:MAG: hypothetical protein MZV70_66170 [Desulfobacterales bacterium]|nr:hypothetical protein [Desulfobacterales bacterium]